MHGAISTYNTHLDPSNCVGISALGQQEEEGLDGSLGEEVTDIGSSHKRAGLIVRIVFIAIVTG